MAAMKLKCSRCDKTFEKPENGRIARLVMMSVHAKFGDSRVNHVYYLCPECRAAFHKWATYKKKGEEK